MKMMRTEEISIRPPFSELFPIEPETFERIREHMRLHGFDTSQPVIVWDGVLVDGHTKLKAALENGIEKRVKGTPGVSSLTKSMVTGGCSMVRPSHGQYRLRSQGR